MGQETCYIFVTGGVVSSLGKGIVAASLGALLERRGLKIALSKADPYINVDPGTMNPTQHGEVFVTEDGAETDLDLGHYERFTRVELLRRNSFSTGQVYDQVINNERKGLYLGATVQVVPHVTAQIRSFIEKASLGVDVSIVEIGGTVGDIESLPYLETIRQMRYELGRQRVMCMHLTLVPYIATAGELKSKPTQHSVKELRSIGIQPDLLVCRCDRTVPQELKKKIAVFCNVDESSVIEALDENSIYKMPMILWKQGLDERVSEQFQLKQKSLTLSQLSDWQRIVESLDHADKVCNIGIIGKYVSVQDSYKSVVESLIHAGIFHRTKVTIHYIDAEDLTEANIKERLSCLQGVIVPGGFGTRGVEGKVLTIKFARENKIPFLGICLGMQLAAIEFARHVLNIPGATSGEFDKFSTEQVIALLDEQKEVTKKGATMRLGAFPCVLVPQTKAQRAYGKDMVLERHRHRYEFNRKYYDRFIQNGMIFSGHSPSGELVEMLELSDHPWFVGCQFHPELKSKPWDSHPLFMELVRNAIAKE